VGVKKNLHWKNWREPIKGKDFALNELKAQLLNEREDFKKRMVQTTVQNELVSGRKSVAQGRASVTGIRRPSLDNTLRLQPSIGKRLWIIIYD
jgi:hypothetical protein